MRDYSAGYHFMCALVAWLIFGVPLYASETSACRMFYCRGAREGTRHPLAVQDDKALFFHFASHICSCGV